MSVHHILEIYPSVEKLVHLDVAIVVRLSRLFAVILFGEKARRSQDKAREPKVPVEQRAKVFRSGLCDAIDVSGHRRDILGHPSCGASRGLGECAAEGTRCAGEY